MDLQAYLYLSMALFVLGIAGVLIRRNAIIVLLCIEMMLGSVNLLLVAFSKMHLASYESFSGTIATSGQLFVFFIMVVMAAETVVGLAIIRMFFLNTKSVDISFLNRLKN